MRDGGPLPRDLVTRKSLENACAAVAATGGSTNAGLHLPAIAHEAGIRFTLDDVAEVFARTPLIADLQPGGRYLAVDLHRVGGVAAGAEGAARRRPSARRRARAVGPHAGRASSPAQPAPDGEVVRAAASALHPTGGVVVLKGNLAPDGALIKIAGLKSRVFEGPARVFECEEDAFAAVTARALCARATCSSSATKGRAAAPACARCSASPRWSTARAWARRSRSLTDGRFSGATRGMMVGYVGPEAALGGPIALVRDGDRIRIDGERARSTCASTTPSSRAAAPPGVPRARRARWPACSRSTRKLVGPAHLGAVTHSGALEWPMESAPSFGVEASRPVAGREHVRACYASGARPGFRRRAGPAPRRPRP